MNISNQLSTLAGQLDSIQSQIPASDTVSVAALQQAYQLISQVQLAYQGQ
jgi:hypothetical protein